MATSWRAASPTAASQKGGFAPSRFAHGHFVDDGLAEGRFAEGRFRGGVIRRSRLAERSEALVPWDAPSAVRPLSRRVDIAMTTRQALAFIAKHGVVLEAAHGPVPSLAAAIAGEPIRGSWWSHPKSHEIFAVTRAVRDSHEILVCRLVKGKVTFVHRRLWPALVRVSDHFRSDRLAQVRESHTPTGRHVTMEVSFPDWVPPRVRAASERLSENAAFAALAECLNPVSLGQRDRH